MTSWVTIDPKYPLHVLCIEKIHLYVNNQIGTNSLKYEDLKTPSFDFFFQIKKAAIFLFFIMNFS